MCEDSYLFSPRPNFNGKRFLISLFSTLLSKLYLVNYLGSKPTQQQFNNIKKLQLWQKRLLQEQSFQPQMKA